VNRVEEAITAHILDDPDVTGAVVTGFIVVASYVDQNGDRHAFGASNEGAHPHEVMGLLSYALAVEQQSVSRWTCEEDE